MNKVSLWCLRDRNTIPKLHVGPRQVVRSTQGEISMCGPTSNNMHPEQLIVFRCFISKMEIAMKNIDASFIVERAILLPHKVEVKISEIMPVTPSYSVLGTIMTHSRWLLLSLCYCNKQLLKTRHRCMNGRPFKALSNPCMEATRPLCFQADYRGNVGSSGKTVCCSFSLWNS